MVLFDILLLVGAGLVGGVLSGLVGGAAIITFPAFLAVGLPPLVATATNMAAMTPPNYLAAFADRGRLPQLDRTFGLVVLCTTLGALAGAALLLLTPGRVLEVLVPVLLGIATVIFAFSRRISDWIRARAMTRYGRAPRADLTSVPIMLPVSIYGGYFGAGAGVMMLAVLSIMYAGDYRTANVTRNLVMSINSTGAALLFVLQGQVEWKPAAILMGGALIGSLVGNRIARIARPDIMHVFVIAMGCLLTGVYTWKYWF